MPWGVIRKTRLRRSPLASDTHVLDNLIGDARIQPVLVVFIQMLQEDIQLFPDKFPDLATMVCDELVPLIDRAYKTAPDLGQGVAGSAQCSAPTWKSRTERWSKYSYCVLAYAI
jgi:enterochelin esterase-like enzyme